MGLEEMLSRIRADTEQQYSRIIDNAKSEALRIVDSARQREETRVSQGRSQSERQAQEERLRSVASARLESKRQILQAREQVIGDYESQAMKLIDQFVKSKEYEDFLISTIKDGVEKIGKDAIVQVNSRDRQLLEEDDDFGYNVIRNTINCKGGALISSADGRRRVDNTIESLLNDRREQLRLKLAEEIFGSRKQ